MPLVQGSSKKAIATNATIEMKHGKSRKQAWAIAFSIARKKKETK